MNTDHKQAVEEDGEYTVISSDGTHALATYYEFEDARLHAEAAEGNVRVWMTDGSFILV
jgi:hypothetical protein